MKPWPKWLQLTGNAAATDDPAQAEELRASLEYEAEFHLLEAQKSDLVNVRDRASALLTVSTLIGSFSAAVGWVSGGHKKGWHLIVPTIALLVAMLLIAFIAIYVLWPRKWYHGPASETFESKAAEAGAAEIKSQIASDIRAGREKNRGKLDRAMNFYIGGLMALAIEVSLIVCVSFFNK